MWEICCYFCWCAIYTRSLLCFLFSHHRILLYHCNIFGHFVVFIDSLLSFLLPFSTASLSLYALILCLFIDTLKSTVSDIRYYFTALFVFTFLRLYFLQIFSFIRNAIFVDGFCFLYHRGISMHEHVYTCMYVQDGYCSFHLNLLFLKQSRESCI